MPRTRHQEQERAREGIPPTPPQQLPTESRPKRTTRQTSRSASAEPASTSTSFQPHRVSKRSRTTTKKSKGTTAKRSTGRPKRSSRRTTPIEDDQPTKRELAIEEAIAEELEVEAIGNAPESAQKTQEPQGYETVPELRDEDGSRSFWVNTKVPAWRKESDTESESEGNGQDRMDTSEIHNPDNQSTPRQSPLQQSQTPQAQSGAAPETPRTRGWGLGSLIPKSVTKFIPSFGRMPTATPEHADAQVPHSVTEPRRRHISTTQQSFTQPREIRTAVSKKPARPEEKPVGVVASAKPPRGFAPLSPLPVSHARNLGRAALFRANKEQARRQQKKTKRQQLEEQKKELEKEREMEREQFRKHIAQLEAEKDQTIRDIQKIHAKELDQARGLISTNPYVMRRVIGEKTENIRQPEQQATPQVDQSSAQPKQKKKKRKRSPSPDVIPLLKGCSYGLDLNYFGYSSSDDDSEESDTEDPAPQNKRRRTISPGQSERSNSDPHVTYPGSRPAPRIVGDLESPFPYGNGFFPSVRCHSVPTGKPGKKFAVKPTDEADQVQSSLEADQVQPSIAGGQIQQYVEEDDDSSITVHSDDSSYWDPVPGPGRTFRVPSPGSSEDESDDEPPEATSTEAASGNVTQPTPSPAKPWDEQTPPNIPAPTPPTWDPAKELTGPEISVIKQREQLMKYAPKTPSRLYQSSRLSNSTIVSDHEEEDSFAITPRGSRVCTQSTQASTTTVTETATTVEPTAPEANSQSTQGATSFESSSIISTPGTTFDYSPEEPRGEFNAYLDYLGTMSPNAAKFIGDRWKLPKHKDDSITLFESNFNAYKNAQSDAQSGSIIAPETATPRVQGFIEQHFTSATAAAAKDKFDNDFAAFKAAST